MIESYRFALPPESVCMVARWSLPTLILFASLLGCPVEETVSAPPPPEPAAVPQDDGGGGGLFASSADEIVMKDRAPSLGSLTQAPGDIREPDDVRKKRVDTSAAVTADLGGRTLTASQVKAVVSAKTPQVRACYEKELKKSSGLSGKVVVSWTISASGKVSGARMVRNTTRNSAMVPCMIRAVSSWTFPQAESPFDVEYPFVFRPKDY